MSERPLPGPEGRGAGAICIRSWVPIPPGARRRKPSAEKTFVSDFLTSGPARRDHAGPSTWRISFRLPPDLDPRFWLLGVAPSLRSGRPNLTPRRRLRPRQHTPSPATRSATWCSASAPGAASNLILSASLDSGDRVPDQWQQLPVNERSRPLPGATGCASRTPLKPNRPPPARFRRIGDNARDSSSMAATGDCIAARRPGQPIHIWYTEDTPARIRFGA